MKNGMMNLELDINMSLKSSWARNNHERQQPVDTLNHPTLWTSSL